MVAAAILPHWTPHAVIKRLAPTVSVIDFLTLSMSANKNSFQEYMKLRINIAADGDEIIGIIILRRTCILLAPSKRADSSISLGMSCMKLTNRDKAMGALTRICISIIPIRVSMRPSRLNRTYTEGANIIRGMALKFVTKATSNFEPRPSCTTAYAAVIQIATVIKEENNAVRRLLIRNFENRKVGLVKISL